MALECSQSQDISWMKEESGELYLRVPEHMVHKIDKTLVPPAPPEGDPPDSKNIESIEHARGCEGKRYCKCCLEREMFCMPPDSLDSRTLVGRLRRKLAERPYKDGPREALQRPSKQPGNAGSSCGDINALVDFIESGNGQSAVASSRKVKKKPKGSRTMKTLKPHEDRQLISETFKVPERDETVACYNTASVPSMGKTPGRTFGPLEAGLSSSSGELECECAVCFTSLSDRHALHPCGHNLFCGDCHELLVSAFKLCPLCRTPIEKVP